MLATKRVVSALRSRLALLEEAQTALLIRLSRRSSSKWEMYWQHEALPPWDPDAPCSQLVQLVQSNAFRSTISKGARALDLGCGSGSNAVYLTQQGFGQVAGVDISNAGLIHARRRETEAAEAAAAAAAAGEGGEAAAVTAAAMATATATAPLPIDWLEADVYKLALHREWWSRWSGSVDLLFDLQCFHVLRNG
jgi:SAM-dependent methyltransferase